MEYKNELLYHNVAKFLVENVVDFEEIVDKWEFLKLNEFNWNDFLDAKELKLIREEDQKVYTEHIASIDKRIVAVARIFSISLNQCYLRKKLLTKLEDNVEKYQSVLDSLDFITSCYKQAISEIEAAIEKERAKEGYDYDLDNVVATIFRSEVDRTKENYNKWLRPCQKIVKDIEKIKSETEKYHSLLIESVEVAKAHLSKEVQIKDKAADKMHAMREHFLYNVTNYNRLGSTERELSPDDIGTSKSMNSEETSLSPDNTASSASEKVAETAAAGSFMMDDLGLESI